MHATIKLGISLALIVSLVLSSVVSADFYNDVNNQYYDKDDSLTACGEGSGAGGGSKPGTDFSLGSDPQLRRVNLMKALLADYPDLTPAQAAGPVGNFMHESAAKADVAKTLPPDVNQGDTTGAAPTFQGGYGWAQWSGGRTRKFINFAIEHGYIGPGEAANDAANYAYLKHELASSDYKTTLIELKKQTTPEDAAISFEDTFEDAGAPALEERTKNARLVFDEYNGGSGAPGGGSGGGACPPNSSGGAAIVGDYAFPLAGSKSVVKNPGMFKNNTADRGGHPYIAFDILANQGTEVVAFLSGEVTRSTGTDRCSGRLISIWNRESNIVVSYLHLSRSNHVQAGDFVAAGDHVGIVGSKDQSCGTTHLHIDAAKGRVRPGCSRPNCPAANRAKFVDIGPQLYTTFQKLP